MESCSSCVNITKAYPRHGALSLWELKKALLKYWESPNREWLGMRAQWAHLN